MTTPYKYIAGYRIQFQLTQEHNLARHWKTVRTIHVLLYGLRNTCDHFHTCTFP